MALVGTPIASRLDPNRRVGHHFDVGPLSWILTVLALNGALMAVLLFATPGTRGANRVLAGLVALITLRLLIYVIGFAGLYDDYPWITFAPLDASLAFGPLLWLYVFRLTRQFLPRHWGWHFVPVAAQLTYSLVAFSLPLGTKLWWFRGPHLNLVEPVGFVAMLISCACYLILAWRRQQEYQRWLDDSFANREAWRLGWITAILAAFAATLLVAILAAVVNAAVAPLDYFSRTPVIIASSLLAYALGLLGWRNAGLNLPAQPLSIAALDDPEPNPSRLATAFARWAMRIDSEQWWREDSLTLGEVASRLGTSERTFSRALSKAAGCNFNVFINGLRVEAVKRAIAAGSSSDMLSLAFECGFNSKASFNRAFLRQTGMTPTRWRTTKLQMPPIDPVGES